jgi:phosphopantetheine--protein transferase-like protein
MSSAPSAALIGDSQEYWQPCALSGCPFGRLVRAICPTDPPPAVLASLHPAEEQHLRALASRQHQRDWGGGRLCLAAALGLGSRERPPLLVAHCGAPLVPPGWSGSISHKGPLVVALASPIAVGAVGIDVERIDKDDDRLQGKVLTAAERERLPTDDVARRRSIVMSFSLKEAVWKALQPEDQEDLDFEDIETVLDHATPQVWQPVEVRLVTRAALLRGAIIFDEDWLIAAAIRECPR